MGVIETLLACRASGQMCAAHLKTALMQWKDHAHHLDARTLNAQHSLSMQVVANRNGTNIGMTRTQVMKEAGENHGTDENKLQATTENTQRQYTVFMKITDQTRSHGSRRGIDYLLHPRNKTFHR